MDYRFIGKTGVRVSQLGFGTMAFGGDADAATSADLYRECRDAGINFFDTADIYSEGRSEEILGSLIRSHRDEIVLATKGFFPTSNDVNARGSSRFHLVRAVEASLKRLGTERLDLYYLHRFDDRTDLAETLRALEDLIRQGKILYPAASNFAAWQVEKALGLAGLHQLSPVVAIQPMYNLLKRTAEIELLPMAEHEGIAVFPYSPLAAGLLTGKYGADPTQRTTGRVVENSMYTSRYDDKAYFSAAASFASKAKERGIHPVSLAVAWVAHHPAVTAPLLGARSVDQLRPALDSIRVTMDAALYEELSQLTGTPPPPTDRSEETTEHALGPR